MVSSSKPPIIWTVTLRKKIDDYRTLTLRVEDLDDDEMNQINMYGKNESPANFIITPKPVDVYEVITKRGYSFECSNKHMVLTQNGFKLAKDLTTNDSLCINNQYKFPSKEMNLDLS